MTGSPALSLKGIGKRFPGVRALDSIDFDLFAGEVHVLLGENGAGKSTLMKILSGIHQPDAGEIIVRGTSLDGLTPESARALGIGLVHQELCLVPALSVAENLFLNAMPRGRLGAIDWSEANARATRSLAALGVRIDPSREVRELDVAEQQLVEIARVLEAAPDILLLDEPTSALSEQEKTRLFEVVRTLKARGVGIIYISHHLAEVPLVADRVTVLRDGRVVGTLPVAEASEARMVEMMVGRDLSDQFTKDAAPLGEVALRAEGLTVAGKLHDVSFELRHGEILGVYGLMGAGQAVLARALFGLQSLDGGTIEIEGVPNTPRRPADAIRAGMGLISRDRRQSLVPMLASGPNISLAWLARRKPWSLLEGKRERAAAKRYIDKLNIEPPLPEREVMFFSGGNQQKVVLARWMSSGARIVIFDEPTRGIDVGAKADVFALMNELAADGAAILMISSEPAELEGMADRALVLREGAVAARLDRGTVDQEALLRHAS